MFVIFPIPQKCPVHVWYHVTHMYPEKATKLVIVCIFDWIMMLSCFFLWSVCRCF